MFPVLVVKVVRSSVRHSKLAFAIVTLHIFTVATNTTTFQRLRDEALSRRGRHSETGKRCLTSPSIEKDESLLDLPTIKSHRFPLATFPEDHPHSAVLVAKATQADFLTACLDDDRFVAEATTRSLGLVPAFREAPDFFALGVFVPEVVAEVRLEVTVLVRSVLAFAMICVFRFGSATDLLFVERVAVDLRGALDFGDGTGSGASSSMPKIAPKSSPTSVLSPARDNSLSRFPSATACVTSS